MVVFFFNDTATTEIYTLSLHVALPIFGPMWPQEALYCHGSDQMELTGELVCDFGDIEGMPGGPSWVEHDRFCSLQDRKSTRLNSSHANISYAVFCLKKKNKPSSPFFCS